MMTGMVAPWIITEVQGITYGFIHRDGEQGMPWGGAILIMEIDNMLIEIEIVYRLPGSAS